jgi:hypothetical protein
VDECRECCCGSRKARKNGYAFNTILDDHDNDEYRRGLGACLCPKEN